MNKLWLVDVGNSEDAVKERKADIRLARAAFKRLEEILAQQEEAALQRMLNKEGYMHSAWPYEQADSVAEVRTLQQIRALISPDKGTKE